MISCKIDLVYETRGRAWGYLPFCTRIHKKHRKPPPPEIPCFYNVDTETLRIVYLNLYKNCVFPCSHYFKCQKDSCFQRVNVSGRSCQDYSCLRETISLPRFGFMNNVLFFSCMCKGLNIQIKTRTHTNIKPLLWQKKHCNWHFQWLSYVMSFQIALTSRKLESTESAEVSTLYSGAQWGIELNRATFYHGAKANSHSWSIC